MPYRADIIVYDRSEHPVLVVEVKRKLGATPEWAADLRRNMLAHRRLPDARFFLVVVPDRMFLWGPSCAPSSSPIVDVPAESALAPYFRTSGIRPATATEWGLEQVTSTWLRDLTTGQTLGDEPAASWLDTSGLRRALRGGSVRNEVAV